MNCYLISYDLREPGQRYQELHQAIKAYRKWAHINESLWAVVTDRTAAEIRNDLSEILDDDDRLFVVRSGVEAAWRHAICSNEWLKKNL